LKPRTLLVIGFGNPARQDDGLGPAFAAAVEQLALPNVAVDSNYQLTVEDAEAVSHYDAAIFADASLEDGAPYTFRKIIPQNRREFSTHSVSPAAVMGLAGEAFQAKTVGYQLGIRGHSFEMFVETMTDAARDNLAAALAFMAPLLDGGDLEGAATETTEETTNLL